MMGLGIGTMGLLLIAALTTLAIAAQVKYQQNRRVETVDLKKDIIQ